MFNHPAAGHSAGERPATPTFLRNVSAASGAAQRVIKHSDATDPQDIPRVRAETNMAQRVCERLQFLYPGHAWECTVDSRTGGVQLRIAILMTGPQCFFFGFDDIATENAFNHFVKVAGGELLERFKIPRSTFHLGAYMDARRCAVFHHNQKAPG